MSTARVTRPTSPPVATTIAVDSDNQRSNIAHWACVGALLALGCAQVPGDAMSVGEPSIVEQSVECDAVDERWHVSALVQGDDGSTTVLAVLEETESHPMTLRWRDEATGLASYAADIRIVYSGPIDLGRSTLWSCNDDPAVVIRFDHPQSR